MLDESAVRTLTFVDASVPTLALLAILSLGNQLKRINLMGWDSDEANMPPDWKAFLAAEKERAKVPAGSVDARSAIHWVRSTGAGL